MKRSLSAIVFALMSSSAHAAGFWLNSDQVGDALLKRGDAKSAARAYSDPHRKGYAQLLSGDYKAAAITLGQLHDEQASYNLGNALAHTGDLEGALRAFEKALKQNPDDRDAKHNRDLVADALKRQSQKQPGGSRKQKDSSGEKPGEKGNRGNVGQKHDASASDKPQKGDDQPPDKNANAAMHGENLQKPTEGPVRPFDDARSKSEQQIEKDQWLHSIPDDPGGLLRRKFLIEHMMRQQEQ